MTAITVMNTKAAWGERGILHSQFYKTASSNGEGRGTQSGQEPEGKG